MYRIYIFGRDSKNTPSELYNDRHKVESLCEAYRNNGLTVRVYWQSQNDYGDIVERLVEDL